jgi:hypothetical protein
VLDAALVCVYIKQRPHLPHQMLTGNELLAKVKELTGTVTKSELVRECGYTAINKDGTERLRFVEFYDQLLKAKGLELGESTPKGRKLTYKTKVQFNGKLQVGDGYIRELGLEPGTPFDIKLGRNSITLTAAA